jgi:hypothetical protein
MVSGYAGVPINPDTTSVSFVPRGEMDGQPKLKLLINVLVSHGEINSRVNRKMSMKIAPQRSWLKSSSKSK